MTGWSPRRAVCSPVAERGQDPARFEYRDHLVGLIARTEAAAARLALAAPERRDELGAVARRDAARLSARLDGSPLTDETAADVDAAGGAASRPPLPPPESRGSWARALRLDGMATQEIAALEYANLLAAYDAETELAPALMSAPTEVIARLHGYVSEGLVEPEAIGRLRTVALDVHDGAQGQVVYRSPDPEALPRLLDGLAAWLGGPSASKPTLVVAGIVHARLLEWQPFPGANGRVARAAARMVLRARGLDPAGVVVPERELAADPLGYHREVAASIRRRGDVTAWLERTGEALASACERAADAAHGFGPPAPSAAALAAASELGPGYPVTLPGYAADRGVDRETARAELDALRRADLLRHEPGTQGLRLRRTGRPTSGW